MGVGSKIVTNVASGYGGASSSGSGSAPTVSPSGNPSFNGVNFFGPCPVSNRIELPNGRQLNAYPGISGVEVLELGTRTSYTEFDGVWLADTTDDLSPFLAQMVAIKRAGGMSTLVDTRGLTSPDAILETWETIGELKYHPGYGWGCSYKLRFLHTGYIPSQSQ